MGMGHCVAGCSERRRIKIIVPEFKPYNPDQIYNRSESGRARHRKYNKSEMGRERNRRCRENKKNKT